MITAAHESTRMWDVTREFSKKETESLQCGERKESMSAETPKAYTCAFWKEMGFMFMT